MVGTRDRWKKSECNGARAACRSDESRVRFINFVKCILYYFDRFGRPVSHGEWPWPKSVGCPASQRRWPSLKGQKIGQIFKISAGRPNSGQVLAEILHLSQGIFKLANAKISATLVPCPTPGRIDRNSTVSPTATDSARQERRLEYTKRTTNARRLFR